MRNFPTTLVLAAAMALPGIARAEMQLQRGFYTSAEFSCAEASNATIILVHKTGINASKVACDFTALSPVGPNTFQYAETCNEVGAPAPHQNAGTIEVLSTTSFRQSGNGWQETFAYCPQSSMPEPWATNDISDMVN